MDITYTLKILWGKSPHRDAREQFPDMGYCESTPTGEAKRSETRLSLKYNISHEDLII